MAGHPPWPHPRRNVARATSREGPLSGELGYEPEDIVDAPEHHEYARAMGVLTWGTWDTEPRPFEERRTDFVQAFPPHAPGGFQGSMLVRLEGGEFGLAPDGQRVERWTANDSSFGSAEEALARFGLKLRTGTEYLPREIEVAEVREVTRARNQRLRMLHGRVDVEADNMDEAKALEIERLEKKQAAEQIREARARMRQ